MAVSLPCWPASAKRIFTPSASRNRGFMAISLPFGTDVVPDRPHRTVSHPIPEHIACSRDIYGPPGVGLTAQTALSWHVASWQLEPGYPPHRARVSPEPTA